MLKMANNCIIIIITERLSSHWGCWKHWPERSRVIIT